MTPDSRGLRRGYCNTPFCFSCVPCLLCLLSLNCLIPCTCPQPLLSRYCLMLYTCFPPIYCVSLSLVCCRIVVSGSVSFSRRPVRVPGPACFDPACPDRRSSACPFWTLFILRLFCLIKECFLLFILRSACLSAPEPHPVTKTSQPDVVVDQSKVICNHCKLELAYHQSTPSMKDHLKVLHCIDSSPALQTTSEAKLRQTTLDAACGGTVDKSTEVKLTNALAKWLDTDCRQMSV